MRERFLAYRRSLPRAPRITRQTVRVRAVAALADLFTPPRSDSLTGAAIAARLTGEGYDWRPILRALSVPTLVFHGTEDALPTEVAEELAELLPQARLALIPDSGHMPFWEAPETLFPAIESFLLARTVGPPADKAGARAPQH